MAEVRKLYAKAAVLGMVESGSHEDEFHQLVYGLTGKESVKSLTEKEAAGVDAELTRRLKLHKPDKRKSKPDIQGMMTVAQQKKAWRLMYSLSAISPSPSSVSERMAGVVRKTLNITASPSDPLRWVNFDDGSRLIAQLKRYLDTAQRKRVKQDESG